MDAIPEQTVQISFDFTTTDVQGCENLLAELDRQIARVEGGMGATAVACNPSPPQEWAYLVAARAMILGEICRDASLADVVGRRRSDRWQRSYSSLLEDHERLKPAQHGLPYPVPFFPHLQLHDLELQHADIQANKHHYLQSKPLEEALVSAAEILFSRLLWRRILPGLKAEVALLIILRYGQNWMDGKTGPEFYRPLLFVEHTFPREDILGVGRYANYDLIYHLPGMDTVLPLQLKTGKISRGLRYVNLVSGQLIALAGIIARYARTGEPQYEKWTEWQGLHHEVVDDFLSELKPDPNEARRWRKWRFFR